MVDAEVLIGHLRDHVKNLQSLLSYLESRERVGSEDYLYSHAKLRELIRRLKDLEKFSSSRGARTLQAEWLN